MLFQLHVVRITELDQHLGRTPRYESLQKRVNNAAGPEREQLQDELNIALINHEMSELRGLVGGTRYCRHTREHKPAPRLSLTGTTSCPTMPAGNHRLHATFQDLYR